MGIRRALIIPDTHRPFHSRSGSANVLELPTPWAWSKWSFSFGRAARILRVSNPPHVFNDVTLVRINSVYRRCKLSIIARIYPSLKQPSEIRMQFGPTIKLFFRKNFLPKVQVLFLSLYTLYSRKHVAILAHQTSKLCPLVLFELLRKSCGRPIVTFFCIHTIPTSRADLPSSFWVDINNRSIFHPLRSRSECDFVSTRTALNLNHVNRLASIPTINQEVFARAHGKRFK
jgi:hypothetical protein